VVRQWAEAQNILDHAAGQEKDALSHLLHFNDSREVKDAISLLHAQIGGQLASLSKGLADGVASLGFDVKEPVDLNVQADTRIPVRAGRGPIDGDYLAAHLPSEEQEWMAGEGRIIRRNVAFELANFINGKRNVTEIRNALSAEFEPVGTDVVARYIENLARAGLVEWR
jgi:hypothetical protein